MALFTKIDLKAYKEKIQLQKANLPLALVFNDDEKQRVNEIYDELIIICDDAIAREQEVITEPSA